MAKIIDDWENENDNLEWLEEFFESLGSEYWFYKKQAIIEQTIEDLIKE